jgi:hypothetical protein
MISMSRKYSSAATFVRPLSLLLGVFLIASCQGPESIAPSVTSGNPSFRADQSWERSSFFTENRIFAECLGEVVRVFGVVEFQYHEVTSGAGNFHFNFQLRPVTPNTPQFFAQGLTSGKLFQYKNGLPINESFHLAAGEVHTIVGNEVYVAANGDRLLVTYRLHVTVNANGELTASRSEFSITCK